MRLAPILFLGLISLALPAGAGAATDALLLRLFLNDGTTLVSYGEYARVDERVICSMIVGGSADAPRLHAATLPAGIVDWARTDRHAASARYQRYADTRGEDDFLRLNNDVAAVLNEILLTKDRARALQIADRARATLAGWPRDHYGYRQQDVQEIVALLDDAISGLRTAAGVPSFNVALVAMVPEVELEPLVPAPGIRQQIDQVFRTATLVDRASERVSLWQSALVLLNEAAGSIPARDIAAMRRRAEADIRTESAVDARYTDLARRLVTQATRAAARANSAGVERVLNRIAREDARLGRRRPEVVQALLATVQGQLDAARRLRLLHDQWTIRRSLYREYQRAVGSQLLQLVKSQPSLEAIRRLEGPPPNALMTMRARLTGGAERLNRMRIPDELRTTHDLLVGSWRFAESALNGRFDAIQTANVTTAWEASSAAAGSLMLLSRVQQEIRAFLEPPRLP